MSTPPDPRGASNWQRVDIACDEFERAKRNGENPQIQDFLSLDASAEERDLLFRELILLDYELCIELGITLFDEERLYTSFPKQQEFIRSVLKDAQNRFPSPVAGHHSLNGKQLGNYKIVSRIGAGGMGEVYLASHVGMDRTVAIKVLRPELVDSQEAINRFHREIYAVAKLLHPNLVRAFDAGESDGVHYLVLEYVDGYDLGTYIRQHGPVDWRTAINIVIQAANGLSYAHQRNIVHRDVKPSNLIVSRDGVVKVLDLGLARIEAEAESQDAADQSLTQVGTIMGTVDYMAPEQSLDTHSADARSDIYSLGCTLFFLLGGEPMYPGDTAVKRLLAHREMAIPSLSNSFPQVPASVDQVFQKMVAKRMQDRFQSMREVAEALQECSGESTVIIPADSALLGMDQQPADTDGGFMEVTIIKNDANRSQLEGSTITIAMETPAGELSDNRRMTRRSLTLIAVLGVIAATSVIIWMRKSETPLTAKASVTPLVANSASTSEDAWHMPGPVSWKPLTPTKAVSLRGSTLTMEEDRSITVSGNEYLNELYQVAVKPDVDEIHAIRLEILPFDSAGVMRIGRNPTGNAHLTKFKLFESISEDQFREVKLSSAWCDYQHAASYTVGITGTIDEDNPLSWHLFGETGQAHEAVFVLDPPLKLTPEQELVVQLHHENLFSAGAVSYSFGHFRFSALNEPYPAVRQQLLELMEAPNTGQRTRDAARAIVDGNPERAAAILPSLHSPILSNEQLVLKLLVGPEESTEVWNEFTNRYGANDTLKSPLQQLALAARGSLDNQGQRKAQEYLWNILYEIRVREPNEFSLNDLSAGILQKTTRYNSLFGNLEEAVLALQELVRRDPDNVSHRGALLAYLALLDDTAEYRKFCLRSMEHYLAKHDEASVAQLCRSTLLMPEVVSLNELPIEIFQRREKLRSDLLSLGLLELRRGNPKEALKYVNTIDESHAGETLGQAKAIQSLAHIQLAQFDLATTALLEGEATIPGALLKPNSYSHDGSRKLIARHLYSDQIANIVALLREARNRLGDNFVQPSELVKFDWRPVASRAQGKGEFVVPDTIADKMPTYEEARMAARAGEWKKASQMYQRMIANEPDNLAYLTLGGLTMQFAGDRMEFAKLRPQLLSLVRPDTSHQDRERLLKVSIVTPLEADQQNLAEIVRELTDETYEMAIREKDSYIHYFEIAQGLALYRAKEYDASQEKLERFRGTNDSPWTLIRLAAGSLIALNEAHQGNMDQATHALQTMGPKLAQFDEPPENATNIDWLMAQLLYRELEETVSAMSK